MKTNLISIKTTRIPLYIHIYI